MSDEAIRKIIREELKSLLEDMQRVSRKRDTYDTRQIESEALQAFNGLIGEVIEDLPHAWDCANRTERGSVWGECSCGLEPPSRIYPA